MSWLHTDWMEDEFLCWEGLGSAGEPLGPVKGTWEDNSSETAATSQHSCLHHLLTPEGDGAFEASWARIPGSHTEHPARPSLQQADPTVCKQKPSLLLS